MSETSPVPASAPLESWSVPSLGGQQPLEIIAMPGEITTIVGANGSGKSALGFWMHAQSSGLTKRLIAHRRLWFPTSGPDISPAQRLDTGRNMDSWSRRADSRFLDHADSARAGVVLFDLLARANDENLRMVARFQSGASPEEVKSEFGLTILDRLNVILERAGLAIKLSLTAAQTFDAVNRGSSAAYPINQMSDGEKSAVLLAAEVICSASDQILIIDEPERHLHRSISAALVDAVISDRPDCHFVVLTHDLDLAATLSGRPGRTLSLAACEWSGGSASGWDLLDVDPGGTLPDSARMAILGGRRDLLFVEGNDHSLDRRLYEILFPDLSLFAAGGADQVIRAVTGLQASADHHWVNAYGLVDGDGREANERAALTNRGILPLPVSEVENLYYLDAVVESVAAARADLVGESAETLHRDAKDEVLQILCDAATLDRLAGKLALVALRRRFVDSIPIELDQTGAPVEVSVPSPYPDVRADLANLASARDYDGLVAALPIRDTAVTTRVPAKLGFSRREDYEKAVRVRLIKDPALVQILRDLIGPLPTV